MLTLDPNTTSYRFVCSYPACSEDRVSGLFISPRSWKMMVMVMRLAAAARRSALARARRPLHAPSLCSWSPVSESPPSSLDCSDQSVAFIAESSKFCLWRSDPPSHPRHSRTFSIITRRHATPEGTDDAGLTLASRLARPTIPPMTRAPFTNQGKEFILTSLVPHTTHTNHLTPSPRARFGDAAA